jgi:hypothetical protein
MSRCNASVASLNAAPWCAGFRAPPFPERLQRATIDKVSGDAGRAECVIADRRVNARGDSVRIPYSDPISPAIPISNRSPFRFQIARGMRSFRHVDFLALVTVVGQPFLVCFLLVRRMRSPGRYNP